MSHSLARRRRAVLRSLMTPLSHGATYAAVAGLVLFGDYLTKRLAVALWSGNETYPLLGGALGIQVVHNTLGAFGTSLGNHTWEVNVGATLAAVLLTMAVCSRLALLDATAPAALGLVAGAGMGNLASLVSSGAGVPDFLALSRGDGGALVFNLADVAAYVGIACCARLAWVVTRAAARRPRAQR